MITGQEEEDDMHVNGSMNEGLSHVIDLESEVCGGKFIDTNIAEDLLFSHNDQKIVISYYFVRVLGCPKPETWDGPYGAIHGVMNQFELKYNSSCKQNRIWVKKYLKKQLIHWGGGKLL